MNLSLTFDDEVQRVAKAENLSIEELTEQLALLLEVKPRQIYNYRSGKWQMSPGAIPLLCKRFKSRALLHALEAACADTEEEQPDDYELTRMVAQTVRRAMGHYERFLAAFEDGVVSQAEMNELLESTERVARDLARFKAIAVEDYERRQRLQSLR